MYKIQFTECYSHYIDEENQSKNALPIGFYTTSTNSFLKSKNGWTTYRIRTEICRLATLLSEKINEEVVAVAEKNIEMNITEVMNDSLRYIKYIDDLTEAIFVYSFIARGMNNGSCTVDIIYE